MKKNLFLTFWFSLIPGAGQMYQGYMKRGLSLMSLFALTVIFTIILSLPFCAVFCFVIFFYSFFDSFNVRNSIGTETPVIDEYIILTNNQLPESLNGLFKKKSLILGIGFLLLGIYLLLNNIFISISRQLDMYWIETIIDCIAKYLPVLIISALSIGFGIKLIFNNNK